MERSWASKLLIYGEENPEKDLLVSRKDTIHKLLNFWVLGIWSQALTTNYTELPKYFGGKFFASGRNFQSLGQNSKS